MKKTITILVAVLMYGTVSARTDSVAQDTVVHKESLTKRIDEELATRYYRTPYDTDYVVRPKGRLRLTAKLNQTGNDFHVKGTMDGIESKADLSTSYKTTVSIGASYRGLGASLSLNPGKMRGVYKDYELNFNYFGSSLSLDFSYQRSGTLAGDIRRGDNLGHLESGDVTLKVVNLAGYYAFNHRRFSFPAAFTQSYIQRRSAGSWLVGISYQGGRIQTSDDLKAKKPEATDISIKINNIGIGGGYGYNWVPGKRWLIHVSMLPTFVVYNNNRFTVNGELKKAKHMRFNMIFNERLAIVHDFPTRYFAGATLVMNNSVFSDDAVVVNQNKWSARAFFGLRL